jgi:periplasmic protein CpxP/Spy
MPNFSKTQVLIFIIAILLIVNIAMVLSFGMKEPAKPGKTNDRPPRRPNPIAFTLKEKVGFSEQQMEQIDQLKKQHREKMHLLFEDIRKAKISFYSHVNKSQINEAEMQALSLDIAKKQQAIELQAFRNFREIRALCTPEQLPRYDSLMPQVIQNMWFPERHGNNKHRDSSKERSHS